MSDEELTIYPSRRGLVVGGLVDLAVAAGFTLVLSGAKMLSFQWPYLVAFGLVVFLVQLPRRSEYLVLSSTGLTISSFGSRHTWRWADLEEFVVVRRRFQDLVAFRNSEHYTHLKPFRGIVRRLSGYDGMLTNSYRIPAHELAALLGRYRDRYAGA